MLLVEWGMKIKVGIIAFLALIGLAPTSARAHPMLERAVVAYEEADFERALRTFDMAAANADLSVEELLQVFEMRALVHHALGDDASMRADLERLVAVRASYQLGRLAPPSVRAAFEVREASAQAGSVELRIEETDIEGEPWVVAKVLRVPDGLVDHTSLQCSVENNARTVSRTSQGTSASVKLEGAHNGCTATARTRQGGVLFRSRIDGDIPSAPSVSRRRFQTSRNERRDDAPATKKKKKWPWIVAASAVVVVGGVTAGVVLSQRSKGNGSPEAGAVAVNW